MATVPKSFAEDFALWERDLLERGIDTPEGIAEIKEAIRQAFAAGGEHTSYWLQRVADEAAFIRSPRARATRISAPRPSLAEPACSQNNNPKEAGRCPTTRRTYRLCLSKS